MSELILEGTPIMEFFKGRTIFITGGSGFMGKVLIEKLLYYCSDIKEILLLMRPKRGMVPESRLENMFKLPMFQRIRQEKPHVLKKLIPVQGDVTFDKLGLSGEVMKKVVSETSIVFHLAATLRLEAHLKDAIQMNTSGTRRVLDLCKQMPKLDSFLHLSTAFCYCDKEVLYEKVFDCPNDPQEIMRLAEWMDEKTLELVTPNLLKPHPNTYTYSKRLAEILVRDEYQNLPVAIARPSIVSPAHTEPLEGWVDSLNGPIGVMIGAGKGVIRTMMCEGSFIAEVIPVDVAINAMIAIVYKEATNKQKLSSIPVYNLTCTESKRVTWAEVLEDGKAIAYQYPFEAGLWYPDGSITTSKFYHMFARIFFHWLPAYLVDFIMLCIGQKRFMCRVQRRISDGLDILSFFTTRAWDFKSQNFVALQKILTGLDAKIFTMDMTDQVPKEYMFKCILGGRQYCLKEPLNTIPKARMQLRALYILDRVTKVILGSLLLWWFLSFTGLKTFLGEFLFTNKITVQTT